MNPVRWTVGAGGFIGEVTVRPVTDPDVLRAVQRPGVPLLFLTELFVHPMRRGRGWSHALLQAAIQHAAAEGADLWLYASPYGSKRAGHRSVHRPTTEELEALYSRHGFRPVPYARTNYQHEMVLRCPARKPS